MGICIAYFGIRSNLTFPSKKYILSVQRSLRSASDSYPYHLKCSQGQCFIENIIESWSISRYRRTSQWTMVSFNQKYKLNQILCVTFTLNECHHVTFSNGLFNFSNITNFTLTSLYLPLKNIALLSILRSLFYTKRVLLLAWPVSCSGWHLSGITPRDIACPHWPLMRMLSSSWCGDE